MTEVAWISDMESELKHLSGISSSALMAVRVKRLSHLLHRARQSGADLRPILRSRAEALLQVCREEIPVSVDVGRSATHPMRPAADVAELTALLDGRAIDEVVGFDGVLQQQELDLLVDFAGEKISTPRHQAIPELKAMKYLRTALTAFDARRRLSQAARDAHEEPGPLNPQKLVTDSLQLMGQLSPSYLERFIAYADTLLWLDAAAKAGPVSE